MIKVMAAIQAGRNAVNR